MGLQFVSAGLPEVLSARLGQRPPRGSTICRAFLAGFAAREFLPAKKHLGKEAPDVGPASCMSLALRWTLALRSHPIAKQVPSIFFISSS